MSDCGEVEVVIDGHVAGMLDCDDVLRVSASPLRARLLVGEGVSFYRNVEEKLFGFGADAHGADAR
jgi:hypothetical protein